MRGLMSATVAAAGLFALTFTALAEEVERAPAKDEDAGPVLKMGYDQRPFEKNPIAAFMYFVPLIATTPVDRQTSAGNSQEVAVVSFKRKSDARTFTASCEFEMRGSGFHRVTFDAPDVILRQHREFKENATLTSLLDYLQFEGEGLGSIDIKGTIKDAKATVTEVRVRFNMRGRKSPVTIGLYDLKPKDGQYTYENRSNQIVARVNAITFKRSSSAPTMGVVVASITKAGTAARFLSRIKGAIANLLIRPPKIKELGNDTMLDFGLALFDQEPEFRFPLADNIRTDTTVEDKGPKK